MSIVVRASDAFHAVSAAQKPAEGVPAYTRWVNRRVARFAVAAAHAIGLTPNAVSAISAVCSACGILALVLLPPSVPQAMAVAGLLALGYVLDSADGQLARLQGVRCRRGEWLDHVVDAFRTPAIHVGTAIALLRHRPDARGLVVVALAAAVIAAGQFMSQILAESLIVRDGGEVRRGRTLRSWVLLPTDPGVLCWSFALWAEPLAFSAVYTLLAAVAAIHCAVSLRRRWQDLRALDAAGIDPGRGDPR